MTTPKHNEQDTRHRRTEWLLPDDVAYLNHGSFGPSPVSVQQEKQRWSEELERQPMDFFLRQMENHLDDAADRLGEFVGANGDNLVFVDNATTAMNIVAASVTLEPGDEVLLTDHEYGAVLRLWWHVCRRTDARVVVQPLPSPLQSQDEVVETFFSGITACTKLIVVSHVTSPTAVLLPVEKICSQARELGIPICIDGPHALAMLPLNLRQLDCDYYTASCHKWLCAPFGTGFLYVHPRRQSTIQPAVISWGGSVGDRPSHWKDEFQWIGTRDPAGFLAVPAALEFLKSHGLERFRQDTHDLAGYARQQIIQLTGLQPMAPDSRDWYGSMVSLPLPDINGIPPKTGHRDPLQDILWERYRIEVPIIDWHGQRLLRVSCHLYNQQADINRLVEALRDLINSNRN